MGNTFSMQASHKLGFLHHIRLVPLFSSILGGILLLFALSAGLAGYFLLQADRDQRDVTDEIQVRMGLSNSANHLRTARINMIHAGAASRIAEMDEMKANIAAAETRIKQSQDGFNAYMSRAVKTPADDALDNELNARYTAYINGLQPMLKFAKNGMFEAIINHENEQAKQLDAAYNHVLDDNPKGFGLLQLDRDFSHYQDVMGWYNKRPSLWVEPRSKWGKGAVSLMEIPTTGETLDNVVCFWQPEKAIKAGDTLAFNYRLYWSAQPPVQSPLARVMATRTGMGGFPEGWAPGEHYPDKWARRFAIDFVGGDLKAAAPKGIEPVITLSSGEAKQIEILYVEPFDGYRIQFDWYPTSDSTAPVDMRMFLRCQGEAISETWLYQYFPPAPDKRRYVDDRIMR
ncbi:TPA_asm: hypothetical protein G3443_000524 [Salmonella enterica]|uniref:Chemotaxis methyl-accepting receptor Tar-related ligand-binding domain-containing protein n=1 Tax=Salmonella enterica TaxID=28901 RepID=A0A729KDM3_SALER|nr:hypothetical protein [Salmonella enterica]